MLVRGLDAFGGAGLNQRYFGNRGQRHRQRLSLALGIAAAAGRVVALVGDLTCQHGLGDWPRPAASTP